MTFYCFNFVNLMKIYICLNSWLLIIRWRNNDGYLTSSRKFNAYSGQAYKSLLLLLNVACLAEKHQIPIWFDLIGVWTHNLPPWGKHTTTRPPNEALLRAYYLVWNIVHCWRLCSCLSMSSLTTLQSFLFKIVELTFILNFDSIICM